MLLLPVRKMRRLFRNFVLLCACAIVAYICLLQNEESYLPSLRWTREGLKWEHIQATMQGSPYSLSDVTNELHRIAPGGIWQLNYYDLPKRKLHALFTEITSANRDTSYLMAPDFTYHMEYSESSVVLYEDFGPGCMFRNYLFPSLPFEADLLARKTVYDLGSSFLHFMVDDTEFRYSIKQMMQGEVWPFIQPLNTKHPKVASGVGVYMPLCYQKYAKVTYMLDEHLPNNLFESMINCSRKDLLCPVKIYSGISRHKFAQNTKVIPFSETSKYKDYHAANLLQDPLVYGPAKGSECVLQCFTLCQKCKQVIYEKDNSGVVKAMFFRVFINEDDNNNINMMKADWNSLLLTMTWDEADKPQVKDVPLGFFMGSTGSVNTFKGAVAGKVSMPCSYAENDPFDEEAKTGYLYFPMPFWEHATIEIENIGASSTICSQVLEVENKYSQQSTGYFHANASFYMDATSGYHTLLDINDQWGHIVGVYMQVDSLLARVHAPIMERWAALQADPVLFIDGTKSASFLGTGREDYFSYAHAFVNSENTSYAFIGVPYAYLVPKGTQSWYCYRFHILDPIPFHRSVKFIVEGIEDGLFEPAKSETVEEYTIKKKVGVPLISHLVVYYSQPYVGMVPTDTLQLGQVKSEKSHQFKIETEIGKSECKSVKPFSAMKKRYLGNSISKNVINRYGRKFSKNCVYTFQVEIDKENDGVILRREFYSVPREWNEKANIYVDGIFEGTWLIPFGTLSDEYSLREEDKLLSPLVSKDKSYISIKIETMTAWYDISYTVYVIKR